MTPSNQAAQLEHLVGRALALNIHDDVLVKSAVAHAHLAGEGVGGDPLGGSARVGLLHHLVDLLKSKTLGLRDDEVGVDEGAGAETTPDEEDGGAEVALVAVNLKRVC